MIQNKWPITSTVRYGNMGLQVTDKHYEHIPERVINMNSTTVMWEVPVITDGRILANRPDIILHDKKETSYLLIDLATPYDSYVNTKETE